mgnify:FL=1
MIRDEDSAAVRLAVAGTIGVWFLAYLAIPYWSTGTITKGDEVHLWSVPSLILAACLALATIGEPEDLSHRVRLQAARFVHGRIRFQVFLSWFFTHRGTGYGLFVLLAFGISAGHFALGDVGPWDSDLLGVPILAEYLVIYFGLGLIVGRWVLPAASRIPRNLRLTPLLLAGLGTIVAAVYQIFLSDWYDRGATIPDLFSPIALLPKMESARGISPPIAFGILGVVAAIVVVLNLDIVGKGVWQVVSAKRDDPA